MFQAKTFSLVLLSCLSTAYPFSAQATFLKDKEMCVGVIASVDGYANIRAQPTTTSKILGTLNKGADVDVYAVVKNEGRYWYRVNRGYIRANQIRRKCAGPKHGPDFPYP